MILISTSLLLTLNLFTHVYCWEALPNIPSGKRSQYLVLHGNGGYKYGYDTGDGSAAKQTGDASNQVEGHYFYRDAAGQDIDLKYTAGVQGFVPEGLEKLQKSSFISSHATAPVISTSYPQISAYNAQNDGNDESTSGDASYNFKIDTDTYKRQESSDSRGNIQGSYSYLNNAGTHSLNYIAGENTGFVATSGTLAKANGLLNQQVNSYSAPKLNFDQSSGYAYNAPSVAVDQNSGAYSFGYSTGDSNRQESSDASGNVQGKYSYQNNAGTHDLSYIAGSQTGFQVTGGSLAKPNGLGETSSGGYTKSTPFVTKTANFGSLASGHSTAPTSDGSYSFQYSTGDQSRQESADTNNNVQGRYSYQNAAGSHDLSYIAGSATGFQVTGGSLSEPNGLRSSSGYTYTPPVVTNAYLPPGSGVISAKISPQVVTNSYLPPITTKSQDNIEDSTDDQANTGDASYSFSIDTDEYKRHEISDAQGNVQGSYSYKNAAGTNDLSYVAGSQTGFVATGGSLSDPNAIAAKIATIPYKSTLSNTYVPAVTSSYLPPITHSSYNDEQSETSSGDASYNFSIDTDEYKRQESSDASGNIKGSYLYKNSVGTHDLSYVAGSSTGFQATGGSLKTPPGLSENQLRSGEAQAKSSSSLQSYSNVKSTWNAPIQANSLPLVSVKSILPSTKTSYSLGNNAIVHTYLPPSNDKQKFGYIYETTY